MRFTRTEMVRVMHDEQAFSIFSCPILLARSIRTQADLVDQLFNSSEKRLARLLLLMADYGEAGKTDKVHSSHYTGDFGRDGRHHPLTRQLLMNRFRRLGFIDYNGRIQVHKSLSRQCSSIACRSMILKRLALGSIGRLS